ncbi:CHAT domain-containing protein [Corynebacterium qintianiae]|uniref:CHAT domain-containing protein n=1 Tax=Corynebacterium qintianiae TaxID=2709392 RepID=A0A7T0KNP4_9CORY|nr:CHAT domain-containing protein [Corynebacterium qintianiae]QPK84081.1 CHAT domain-containing protein [Corynebacterium qintianiae]
MSASQIARELERAQKAKTEAEKKTGEYRTLESQKRMAAEKALESAGKTTSDSTRRMRISEHGRRLKEAQDAGKKATQWQKKASDAAKKVSDLTTRLTKAQSDEAAKAEKKRAAEHEKAMAELKREQAALKARVVETGNSVVALEQRLPAPIAEKLRILVLTSDPKGTLPGERGLRLGREQKRISQAVKSATHRDWVEFDFRTAATPEDLLDGLTEFSPHVLHFSGHSNEEIILFEEDQDGSNPGRAISPTTLSRALAAVDNPPSLVVLNSCKSAGQLDTLTKWGIPFVVGMLDSIGDTDAIVFSARFYATIANGQSLASAVATGQVALEMAGLPGSELPVLAHAGDVDPSNLFLVKSPEGEIGNQS